MFLRISQIHSKIPVLEPLHTSLIKDVKQLSWMSHGVMRF